MMVVCSMNSAAQVAIPQLLKVNCFVSLQWSIVNYIVSCNTPRYRSRSPYTANAPSFLVLLHSRGAGICPAFELTSSLVGEEALACLDLFMKNVGI